MEVTRHDNETRAIEYLKKLKVGIITPADLAVWNRGASYASYHDLDCAKTFALMGKHFAEILCENPTF